MTITILGWILLAVLVFGGLWILGEPPKRSGGD
jgi:hypothetical protein